MRRLSYLTFALFLISISSFAQTGFIDLKSEPSGAKIYIENVYKGETPGIIETGSGKHRLKLELKGYETSSKTIEILDGLVLRETIKLRAYGRLNITSSPSGSNVYVDNKKISQKTPVSDYFVSAGNHSIKVTNYTIAGLGIDGLSLTKNIKIQSRQSRTVHINFHDELGALSVRSTPEAEAYINGEYMGDTPSKFRNLKKGKYDIQFKAYLDDPYFEELKLTKSIVISARKTGLIDVNFYDHFKLGTFTLKSNTNNDFEVLRIESDYRKAISTETTSHLTGDISLITGQYVLKWSDVKSNELAFDVSGNQHASIFAPVKEKNIPEYHLSDIPNYSNKKSYISKYYIGLPESKQVSRAGWGIEGANMDFSSASDYIAIPVFYGSIIVLLAGALTENNEQMALGSIGAAVGFFSIPFYKKTKTKELKSNISKNRVQYQKLVNQYDDLLIKMQEDLKEKNKPIIEKNKKIRAYNRSLPPAEVKYEKKSSN